MREVLMVQTSTGSEYGYKVNTYLEGQTYKMEDSLARVFVDQLNVAIYTDEVVDLNKEKVPEILQKSMGAAPENKALNVEKPSPPPSEEIEEGEEEKEPSVKETQSSKRSYKRRL